MAYPILVLGGYGRFGRRICRLLARDRNVALVVGGRSASKARDFSQEISSESGNAVGFAVVDVNSDLEASLSACPAKLVIHTAGPFQGQEPLVARACLASGKHYIDLSDDIDFIRAIAKLDEEARKAGLLLVSGASTFPALTEAVTNHYFPQFKQIDGIDMALLVPGRDPPGLATIRAVLSYCGEKIATGLDGGGPARYGWHDLVIREYPEIGRRMLAACDVPDLQLFPIRYPGLKDIRFRVGIQPWLAHVGFAMMGILTRFGLVSDWLFAAPTIAALSDFWRFFGSDKSCMRIMINGVSSGGMPLCSQWTILARRGHGPYIPCAPSVALARKLVAGFDWRGAMPCVGLLNVDEILAELKGLEIQIFVG
jgi:saccharopine dehydrogenase-like NADP-dependent oxidoreductase